MDNEEFKMCEMYDKCLVDILKSREYKGKIRRIKLNHVTLFSNIQTYIFFHSLMDSENEDDFPGILKFFEWSSKDISVLIHIHHTRI